MMVLKQKSGHTVMPQNELHKSFWAKNIQSQKGSILEGRAGMHRRRSEPQVTHMCDAGVGNVACLDLWGQQIWQVVFSEMCLHARFCSLNSILAEMCIQHCAKLSSCGEPRRIHGRGQLQDVVESTSGRRRGQLQNAVAGFRHQLSVPSMGH